MECLFCRISEKKIAADIVYEDDQVLAFRDIAPQAPMHVLVIPRRHFSTLNDLTAQDEELIGKIILRAGAIAADFGYTERGYRLVMNCNRDGGQSVNHVHCHVLGGRVFHWPPG